MEHKFNANSPELLSFSNGQGLNGFRHLWDFYFLTPLFISEEISRPSCVTPEKVQCTAYERNAMANNGKMSKGLKSRARIQGFTSVPLLPQMQRWQTMMWIYEAPTWVTKSEKTGDIKSSNSPQDWKRVQMRTDEYWQYWQYYKKLPI